MLEIRNVHKTFNPGTINEKHALNGVNLKLEEGDFVTVIGGNGAGKSTMLNAVAGTWPVDDGSILIDGVDVTGLPEFKRASFLGRVFQDPMTELPQPCRLMKTSHLQRAAESAVVLAGVSQRLKRSVSTSF